MPTKAQYRANPDQCKANYNKWRDANRERVLVVQREAMRKHLIRKRSLAHEMLGGSCVRCGFSDTRALQIDHIDGSGRLERKTDKGGNSIKLYRRVIAGETGLQLLCANCNWIKRHENRECNHHSLPLTPFKQSL